MSNASKLNEFEQQMLAIIIGLQGNQFTQQAITDLITATNKDSRCKFVKITDYNSDKSGNTELASHLVNINVNYANVLAASAFTFDAITDTDLTKVDVNDFDYSGIDYSKFASLEAFKAAIQDVLKVALIEMKLPKKERETNDIWLNKALIFNKTTCRFSIWGQSESKEVSVKGDFKKVKADAANTIAKKLIEKTFKPRQSKLRRFALDNIFTSVKINGDVLEFA